MSRRQVITLQAGGFANYVGAHFWNAQDEAAGLAGGDCGEAYAAVDSAVLYREGCSAQVRLFKALASHCCSLLPPRS